MNPALETESLALSVPRAGTVWQHKNGNLYIVLFLTNDPPREGHPTGVVYRGENGKLWSRDLADWHRSFEQVAYMATNDHIGLTEPVRALGGVINPTTNTEAHLGVRLRIDTASNQRLFDTTAEIIDLINVFGLWPMKKDET